MLITSEGEPMVSTNLLDGSCSGNQASLCRGRLERWNNWLMYQMLIVDDEVHAVKGIRSGID